VSEHQKEQRTTRRHSDGRERRLEGLKVAILVTDAFEQIELTSPRDALTEAGAQSHIIAPKGGQVQAHQSREKADKFNVDKSLDQANPDDYDAVMLPGGTYNADKLRVDPKAQEFVRRIDEQDKPVAVICHAPWLLVSAGLVKGRTLTSYHSLKDDIRNAGGRWLDMEVVRDRNWVSSRNPDDLPAFNQEMIKLFSERMSERASAGR
jgi:protease I